MRRRAVSVILGAGAIALLTSWRPQPPPRYALAYIIISDIRDEDLDDEEPDVITGKLKDEVLLRRESDSVTVVASKGLPQDTARSACARTLARSCDFVFLRERVSAIDSEQITVALTVESRGGGSFHRAKMDPSRCPHTRDPFDWRHCREMIYPDIATLLRAHAASTHLTH